MKDDRMYRTAMNCSAYSPSNDSGAQHDKQKESHPEKDNLRESVESIESLLDVKLYNKCGKPTDEGRCYAMLAVLRNELYSGEWGRMLKDLSDRLAGRPHIFKLVDRIEKDIKRIEKLQEAEKTNQSIVDILIKYNSSKKSN